MPEANSEIDTVTATAQGKSPEDAEDLTQQFFSRLLEKNYLGRADRDRGKFRTFLLASMNNFLVNEWKRSARLKRGGGQSVVSLDLDAAEDRYAAEPGGEPNSEDTYDGLRSGIAEASRCK